jgi:hypothetical protein
MKAFPADNYISVCENKCTIAAADITKGSVTCQLPSVSTKYSNTNFKIAESTEDLRGKIFGTSSHVDKAFDGLIPTRN